MSKKRNHTGKFAEKHGIAEKTVPRPAQKKKNVFLLDKPRKRRYDKRTGQKPFFAFIYFYDKLE